MQSVANSGVKSGVSMAAFKLPVGSSGLLNCNPSEREKNEEKDGKRIKGEKVPLELWHDVPWLLRPCITLYPAIIIGCGEEGRIVFGKAVCKSSGSARTSIGFG